MTKAKILILDIETAPMLLWAWSLLQKFFSIDNIYEDWHLLTWAAKWLNDEHVLYDALWMHPRSYKRNKKDDRLIVHNLWHLLDEADIVVAHNGRKFDVRKVNAKFYEYGMSPPSPYRIVDTLETIRGKFGLTSNKLDYVAQLRGFGNKLETDFQLWKDVKAGIPEAQDKMVEYNIHDVELLEDVYLDLLPWIHNHPNLTLYSGPTEAMTCPRCGSDDMKKDGTVKLIAGIYQQYKCKSCGGWARGQQRLNKDNPPKTTLRDIK